VKCKKSKKKKKTYDLCYFWSKEIYNRKHPKKEKSLMFEWYNLVDPTK
jgi:hypothetical protein